MTIVATPRSDDTGRVLESRTAYVDELVARAWSQFFGAAPAALLAVGGYGRRELFPYSDIDLLLLFDSDKAALAFKETISAFLQLLWDSRLRISQSVRTVAECVEVHDQNVELNISLLDQRYLAGDSALYDALAEKLPRFLRSRREALTRNLAHLTRERHAKYQDTFYHLEPNLKETPGGLRDHQLVCWLAELNGGGTPDLHAHWEFLAGARCHLHQTAGRDANVLTFDAQEEIAEHAGLDPAAWMRDYFRHAREIYRSAARALDSVQARHSQLLTQFRDWRSRVSTTEFSVSRDRVFLRSPHLLDADPDSTLRLFQFVARHGFRLSSETCDRIAARLPGLAGHFAGTRAVWPAIAQLLALPLAHIGLREMHETGALFAVFPELRDVECLVIRDFYHRYTVDEHTLVAIQTLSEVRNQRSQYADILSEFERPELLNFSLLFHDVGKAGDTSGHVDGSVRLANAAMERIGMPQADREMVRFLIGCHLDLSSTMHSRDLYDPATAVYLAGRVETVERLKALTLLTYADISAVNPTAMTPWRADQLWQVYLVAYNELTRELETDRIEAPAARHEFLRGFPTRYLRTHTPPEVEAHARLIASARERGVAVEIGKSGGVYRLTLVAPDRPGLFASAAGTISSFGMNILKAEAFANRAGIVLDTFAFADPSRTLDLNPTEIDRLRITMERVLLGKADVRHLLQNRPKVPPPSRGARVNSSVSFDDTASTSATLIQIVAEDRPGLLYDIATAISSHDCNIEVVLIDTEAHKAIDVFYVTSEGQKLPSDLRDELGNSLRRVCANG